MPEEYTPTDMEEEYRLNKLSTMATLKRELSTRNSNRKGSATHPPSSSPNGSIISLTRTPTGRSLTRRRRRSASDPSLQQKQLSPVSAPSAPELTRQKTIETLTSDKLNEEERGNYYSSENDTPKEAPPLSLRIRYGLWKSLQWTKRYEFKFSLKMAVAVLVLCMPAFFPSSAAWYLSVRGQWSCMTVIAIMNPTR
jgi:hypothetical protein